jgi:hypothetical protein
MGYYRKFVRNYDILARPLTILLKKGQFGWTAKAENSFKLFKQSYDYHSHSHPCQAKFSATIHYRI